VRNYTTIRLGIWHLDRFVRRPAGRACYRHQVRHAVDVREPLVTGQLPGRRDRWKPFAHQLSKGKPQPRAIALKQPGKLPRKQHAGRAERHGTGNSGDEGPRHRFCYREPAQIPVTTGISPVLSRPASPHSTGYHSPLSGVFSPSHHANTFFHTALRADGRGGIVKPACNCATCGPAERDRSPVPASSSRIRVRTAHNGY